MAAALRAFALASLGENLAEAAAERRESLPRGPARRSVLTEGLGPAKILLRPRITPELSRTALRRRQSHNLRDFAAAAKRCRLERIVRAQTAKDQKRH